MSLPLTKILDYLADAGSGRDVKDFCWTSLLALERLIPFDCASMQLTNRRRELLDGSRTYRWPGYAFEDYRSYYIQRDPARANLPEGVTAATVDWRPHTNLEIVSDFLIPNRICSVGAVFLYDCRNELYVVLHYSRSGGRGFTERDLEIMQRVQPHLGNLLADLTIQEGFDFDRYGAAELAPGSRLLSRREAEVARLFCRRLSAARIARILLISRRTVERHVENIYGKLGVGSKQELIQKLLGGEAGSVGRNGKPGGLTVFGWTPEGHP